MVISIVCLCVHIMSFDAYCCYLSGPWYLWKPINRLHNSWCSFESLKFHRHFFRRKSRRNNKTLFHLNRLKLVDIFYFQFETYFSECCKKKKGKRGGSLPSVLFEAQELWCVQPPENVMGGQGVVRLHRKKKKITCGFLNLKKKGERYFPLNQMNFRLTKEFQNH